MNDEQAQRRPDKVYTVTIAFANGIINKRNSYGCNGTYALINYCNNAGFLTKDKDNNLVSIDASNIKTTSLVDDNHNPVIRLDNALYFGDKVVDITSVYASTPS